MRNRQLDFVSLGPGIVPRGLILLCRIILRYRGLILLSRKTQLDFVSLGLGIVPRGLILLSRKTQLDFVSLGLGIVPRGLLLLCGIILRYRGLILLPA